MAAMRPNSHLRRRSSLRLEFWLGAAVTFVAIVGLVVFFLPSSDSRSHGGPAAPGPRAARAAGSATDAGGDGAAGTRNRYLVVSSSSCEDIAPPKPWLYDASRGTPAYDVILIDYSANNTCAKYVPPRAMGTSVAGRSIFSLQHRPRTFKWPAMHALFTSPEGLALLTRYTHFMLSDDDVDFHEGAAGVARLFSICDRAGLHVCQPALSGRSAVNFQATAFTAHGGISEVAAPAEATAHVRLAGFVEQMVPLFSREALMGLLPYFRGLTHAWGIDALWSDAAARLGRPIGVVDTVLVDHMRPSGVSGLYKRIGGIEKARADQAAFKARFGIAQAAFDAADARGRGEVMTLRNALPWEPEGAPAE